MDILCKQHKILIIDDDPLFRNLMVTMLRTEYMVSVASDGMDGFHKATEHPPDIAIVDIQMPGWDGLQTLREFRKHHALQDTMVLMLTADASRATVVAAIQEGANDYLIKTNFNKDELKEKINRLINKKTRRYLELSRNQRSQLAHSERSAAAHLAEQVSAPHEKEEQNVPEPMPAPAPTPTPEESQNIDDVLDCWD